MTYFDHYKEAKNLAEALRKEKLDNYADKIILAMEEGSTGTEIFMALRWNVQKVMKLKNIPSDIRNKATRLYEEFDKALH
jgi:hypothetical protein